LALSLALAFPAASLVESRLRAWRTWGMSQMCGGVALCLGQAWGPGWVPVGPGFAGRWALDAADEGVLLECRVGCVACASGGGFWWVRAWSWWG
jgi:hypothetical protein